MFPLLIFILLLLLLGSYVRNITLQWGLVWVTRDLHMFEDIIVIVEGIATVVEQRYELCSWYVLLVDCGSRICNQIYLIPRAATWTLLVWPKLYQCKVAYKNSFVEKSTCYKCRLEVYINCACSLHRWVYLYYVQKKWRLWRRVDITCTNDIDIDTIYTIILLNCMSQLPKCRSQFLLDRIGRCLNLFVSIERTSAHEFAFQLGLDMFYTLKTSTNYRENRLSSKFMLNVAASGRKEALLTPVTVDRSPGNSGNGKGHSGDILSQTCEKQQVKTVTTRMYTFTAWTNVIQELLRSLCVCLFSMKNCFLMLSRLKIYIILFLNMLS